MAVNDVFLPEEFGGDVQEHVDTRNQVLVPPQVFRQPVAQDCGRRGKNRIVGRHKEHRLRNVRGAPEGKLPVQGEIPQDAEGQGDEIGGPIGPVQQLVQQGETAQFDDAGTGRKQNELQESPSLIHGLRQVSVLQR